MSFVALGNIAPVDAFVEMIKPVADRTNGEKMALLLLRRNDMARACVAIGDKLGWKPQRADWRKLLDAKLAKRQPPKNYLVLTSHGLAQQTQLATGMAKISGLHFLLPHSEDRFNVIARCSCGWHAHLSKNAGHLISGQFAAFGQHIDAVRKGIWKQPRSVDEIVAETIARQTAPMVPAQLPADVSDIDAASEVYTDGEDIETSFDLLEEGQ